MSDRQMALTPDLVARVHRVVEDSGPLPGLVYHTEDDYDAAVQEMLASHSRAEDLWLFAYGSLIWKPEIEHVEERIGTARGWHRSFCLRLVRWRGTREQPGLMMALDRGGQCKGMAYRLAGHNRGSPAREAVPSRDERQAINQHAALGFGGDGSRTCSRHCVRGEPKRNGLCGQAHARGNGRRAIQGVWALGHVRRVPAQHRLAPGGARHPRPQSLEAAAPGG